MRIVEKPVTGDFKLQLVNECCLWFYPIFFSFLLVGWCLSEKAWYFSFCYICLILFEPLRVYLSFTGNLMPDLKRSLLAIYFGLFPLLPLCLVALIFQTEVSVIEWLALLLEILIIFASLSSSIPATLLFIEEKLA